MSVTKDPTISIITVSYNQGDFIRQNIESVLQQNYSNVEHIIVDGGSTDKTLSILKEYPHLKWTSEPDRGQSHALNKGFQRASGDFLGWINSDDWLAPNCLKEVVEALKEAPVVMGMCEKSDRYGKQLEVNPNVPRSFYDILKYWVMFSTPDQPGVFFRKSVLEAVKRADGTYLDEELDYCMDVELWLRISKKFEFKKRVPRITSHFRSYEDSKTGGNMAAAYRETSRVFVRHASAVGDHDRSISYIVPIRELTPRLAHTIDSLSQQVFQDFEIVIVDYGNPPEQSRKIKRTVIDLGETYKHIPIRYSKAYQEGEIPSTYFHAVNCGSQSACAPLLAIIEPGTELPADYGFQVTNLFKTDPYGMALPLKGEEALRTHLSVAHEGMNFFNLNNAFTTPAIPPSFVIRKVAMQELGGIRFWNSPHIGMKELLLRLSHKSWSVSVDNSLALIRTHVEAQYDQETYMILTNYLNATIIVDIQNDIERDPFAETRIKNGIKLSFPASLVEASKKLLARAPQRWEALSLSTSPTFVEAITRSHPEFAPAWYLLSQHAKENGDQARADAAYARFVSLRGQEMI